MLRGKRATYPRTFSFVIFVFFAVNLVSS